MAVTETSRTSTRVPASNRPTPDYSNAASTGQSVDTSNLSPGAAARYEKLMRSIDALD